MRIVVHGQEAFGKAVLEKLLKRKENVVAVSCAPDKAGAKADPLKEAALAAKGLPVHQPRARKTPEALELMKSFNADSAVMAYVHAVRAGAEFLNAPTHGTFQYHPSLLPAHRGASRRSTGRSPWARSGPACRSSGRTRASMTGDVLIQKKTPIGPDETLGDVYFKKLFPMGVDAMMERLELVRAGKARASAGPSRRRPTKAGAGRTMAEIDWAKPWAQIYNVIRAANPAPGAWSTIERQEGRHLRQALRQGPQGHRRQARRDRGRRRRRLHVVCARRRHPGQARARRRRQEDRGRRMGQDRRPHGRRHVRQGLTAAQPARAAQRTGTAISSPILNRILASDPPPSRGWRPEQSKGVRSNGREVRYRDRARSQDEADRGGRREARHPRRAAAALRPRQGEDLRRLHQAAQKAARTAS